MYMNRLTAQTSVTLMLLVSLLLSGQCLAFGAKGHRVVGDIAGHYLTDSARLALQPLLDDASLAGISTWADEMRSATDNPQFWGYDYSANWHFVNIPAGQHYHNTPPHPRGDAYAALLACIAILRHQDIQEGPVREGLIFYFGDIDNDARRPHLERFALRFLVHLVGDLHQPLHVGYEEDRGGNSVNVRWLGQNSNLHRVWDTQLVEHAGLSVEAYSRRLRRQIDSFAATERQALGTMLPSVWMEESRQLLDTVYTVQNRPEGYTGDYAAELQPVIDHQLLKAGLRLAYLLNIIFSP